VSLTATSSQAKYPLAAPGTTTHSGSVVCLLILFWAAIIVTAMGASETWLRGLMISTVATTIFFPIIHRVARGQLDLFEPIVPSALATTVMFVGRPIADQVTESYIHLGYDIQPTFDWALFAVVIGILAFNMGYSSGLGRHLQKVFPTPARQFPPRQTVIGAATMAITGSTLFSIFLIANGGFRALLIVISGRSNEHSSMMRQSSAYLYFGIFLLLPATLVFFALWMKTRRLLYLACTVLTGVPLFLYESSMGDRSEMLPLVFGIPAIYYLWRGRRPKAFHLIAATLVLLVGFAFLREFRNTTATGRKAIESATLLTDPGKALASTFTKDDSEMFDTFCNLLMVVPSRIPFQPWGPVTDIGTRALPRILFPDKGLELPDQFVVTLWPQHYKLSRASSAFSILGHYYMYGGVLGVAIGAFCMGLLLRQTWLWYLAHSNNLNAVLLYSFVPSFVVILWRGTVTDTLGRMVFTVLPLVAMQSFIRSRTEKASTQADRTPAHA
jgi:hypothetical protein